jgi:hypothetical protein
MKKLLSFAALAVVFAMVAVPVMACNSWWCDDSEPSSITSTMENRTDIVSVPVAVSNTGLNMQDEVSNVGSAAWNPYANVTTRQTMTTGNSNAESTSWTEIARPSSLCDCVVADKCDCPNQTYLQSNRVKVLSVPIALSNTGLNMQRNDVFAANSYGCRSEVFLDTTQTMKTGNSVADAMSWTVVNGRIDIAQ